MSAFMMSNETLSRLANLIYRYHCTGGDAFGFYFPEELFEELFEQNGRKMLTAESIFNSLANLNVSSLEQRYPDGYKSMLGKVEYKPECDIWRHDVMNLEYCVHVI